MESENLPLTCSTMNILTTNRDANVIASSEMSSASDHVTNASRALTPTDCPKQHLQVVWCDPTHNYPTKSNATEFSDLELMLVAFFKCSFYDCFFHSNDPKRFTKHLKKHEGSSLYCVYCDNPCAPSKQMWNANEQFVEHLLSNHGQRVYQCNKCVYRARSKVFLEMHLSAGHPHSKEAFLGTNEHFLTEDCVLQGQNLVDGTSLTETEIRKLITARQKERNTMILTAKGQLQCLYCKDSANDRLSLLIHMSRFHPDKEAIYVDFLETNDNFKSTTLYSEQCPSLTTDNESDCTLTKTKETPIGDQQPGSSMDIERPNFARVLQQTNDLDKETERQNMKSSTETASPQDTRESRYFNIGKRKRVSHLCKERREAMVIDQMDVDVASVKKAPSNVLNANLIQTSNQEACSKSKAQTESNETLEFGYPCRQRPQRLAIPTSRPKKTSPNVGCNGNTTGTGGAGAAGVTGVTGVTGTTSSSTGTSTHQPHTTVASTTSLSEMSLQEKLMLKTQPVRLDSNTIVIPESKQVRSSMQSKVRNEELDWAEGAKRKRLGESGFLQKMRAKCGKSFAANTNIFNNTNRKANAIKVTEGGDKSASPAAPTKVTCTGKSVSGKQQKTPCFPVKSKRQCSINQKGQCSPPEADADTNFSDEVSTSTAPSMYKYFCLFCEVRHEKFDMMRDHFQKHLFDIQCPYCHFSDQQSLVVEQHLLIRHNQVKKFSPTSETRQAYLMQWIEKFLKYQHQNSEFSETGTVVSNSNSLQCPMCAKAAIMALKAPKNFETLKDFKDHFYEHSCWDMLLREAALYNQYDNASSFLKKTIKTIEQTYTSKVQAQ